MEEESLFERFQTMPKDDLESFLLTTQITSKASAFIGIGSIFLTLIYTGLGTIIITAFVLYIFGQIAVASSLIGDFITNLLQTKFKDK